MLINYSCLFNSNMSISTYLVSHIMYYVVKMYSQKFDLCVQFIALLHAFVHCGCMHMRQHASPERVCISIHLFVVYVICCTLWFLHKICVNLYSSLDIDINKNPCLVVLCIAISIKLLNDIWFLLYLFE